MGALTISDLEKKQNLDLTSQQVIEIMLNAINDWPNQINSFDEYEIEVRDFVGGDVTKQTIDNSLKQIDYSTDSWKAESLTQIIQLFDFYKNETTLKEILETLKKQVAI